MAKPASLPRWSETAAGVPGSNEVEPTSGKKDTGWGTGGDIPTSGGLNWWMRLVYKWIEWVNAAASLATASVLVVRDADGRAQFADPADVADADTKGARDSAITTHNAVTNPHSATAAATASRLVLRDANGRAAVATPSAAEDIATKGYVDGKTEVLAVKTSDQTLTTSSVAVSGLTASVEANATYEIDFMLPIVNDTATWNLTLTAPASPTKLGWAVAYRAATAPAEIAGPTLNAGLVPYTDGGGIWDGWIRIKVHLQNGANAGSVGLNASYGGSGAGAATVLKGARVSSRRLI